MGIICGARKSFVEFSLRLSIQPEPVDLQQEISGAQPVAQHYLRTETDHIICAKKYRESIMRFFI
jgi:hypothetical protein